MPKLQTIYAKGEVDTHKLQTHLNSLWSDYNSGKLTDNDVEKEITFENLSKFIDIKNIKIETGDTHPTNTDYTLPYR